MDSDRFYPISPDRIWMRTEQDYSSPLHLLDGQGNIITDKPVYLMEFESHEFDEGLQAVCNADHKWGYIGLNGQEEIPFIYNAAYAFDGELARYAWAIRWVMRCTCGTILLIEVNIMRKLLSILLLLLLPAAAWGESSPNLEVTTAEAKERFLQNASLVVWKEKYADRPILCFDVRDDGMIALGFNRPRGGKYAAILDPDGTFRYGYAFQCTGSFLLDWTDEGLGIIWVRSNMMGVFDESGRCLSLGEYENDRAFRQHANHLSSTSRQVGDVTYTLRNDHVLSGLATAYAQLIRTDALGERQILHDASGASLMGAVWIAATMIFVAVCVVVSARKRQAATSQL